MVIGNGVGNRAGLIDFEHHLQAVVFAANLIVGHLVPSVVLNILERPAPEIQTDPAMARNTAAVLNPAAQKSSSDASSP